MDNDIGRLTEREAQALRLLLRGHDAKSIAGELRLSVHTVNERLRDARRKLGATSSREAARILAAREGEPPQKLGDEDFGMAAPQAPAADGGGGRRLLWLSGGMFVMAVITAVLALALAAGRPPAPPTQEATTGAAPAVSADPAALQAARNWLGLIDARQWDASWRDADSFFRSKVSAAAWADMAQKVSAPLGPALSRRVRSVTTTDALPDGPPGVYQIIQFDTDFTNRKGAVETVALMHEGAAWRVGGYFIR